MFRPSCKRCTCKVAAKAWESGWAAKTRRCQAGEAFSGISILLGRIAHLISCHDKQCHEHALSGDEHHGSCCGQGSGGVVNVDQVVSHPAEDITHTQRVQPRRVEMSQISGDYGGSEEADILKAILLSALSTHETSLGGGVDALIFCHDIDQGSRLSEVDFSSRRFLVEKTCVPLGSNR